MGIKFKSPLQLSAHRSIAHSDTAKTLIVKVIDKTAAHPEHGNGSSSGYTIDGVEGAYLELTPGNIYKFDQSDNSNSSHPLRFYEEANKTTAYTTGVITNGTAGSSGAYTQITPTTSTPPILFYQCSSHSLMGSYVKFGTGTIGDTYSINVSADGNNVDLNLDAASGTDSTVQLTAGTDISLTRNDANQVTIASTASGETYDLNATADGSNVDLNLTSTSGNDTSVVQLTAGTNVTLARNSANEITISSALANPSDSISVEKNIHTGDGSDTTFDASSTIVNENNIQIYIDGVYQSKDTYSTSGATVTFSTAPATGSSIEFMHYVAVSGVVEVDLFTGDGSDTTFDISTTIATENKTQIYIDGVYQSKDTYSTNGTTVTFSTAPGNGAKIEIVHLLAANDTVNSNEIVDSAVVTAKLADNSVTKVKMADNAVGHDELSARYTESIAISTLTGTVAFDCSTGSVFKLSGDLTGAYTINLSNYKKGQIVTIYPLKAQSITLAAQGSNSNTFNKVAAVDYDNSTHNILQLECTDDSSTDPVFFYSMATYTSDNTP
tara:strand:- start:479 stop:2134 length:1656 start_codon:yes stop_codon:yes gene_type:complete